MPPPPSFDYYAELQVKRSASLTEINSAYRRLARIHHPDKNPDNQEEATTIFQRLQLAHETLSDPDKRERYDNGDLREDDDDDDPFGFPPFPFPFPFPFEFFFTSRIFRGQPRPASSQAQANYKDAKEENERRRQENKRREKEARELREKQQRLRREAEEASQRAAEQSKALERRRLQDEEQKKQEKRWREMGSISEDERLSTCLHSELCDKVQHTKKFKCGACGVKRGMIAFECPHCSAFLCQLCVTNFSEKRMKLEAQEQTKESGKREDSAGVSDKPTNNQSNANKSTPGQPATKKPEKKKSKTDNPSKQTSAKPTSGKSGSTDEDNLDLDPVLSEAEGDKTAPTSGGQYASDNPYDILADDDKATSLTAEKLTPDASTPAQTVAPLSAAGPDDAQRDDEKPTSAKLSQSQKKKKKRQNKKPTNNDSAKENVNPNSKNQQTNTGIAAEPKATGAIHTNHRQTMAPGSSVSSAQYVTTQTVSNNTIKDNMKTNESMKPQELTNHNAPSGQEKRTGSGRNPKAGATGGYIRALDPAHSLNVADLRRAMETFGAVRSLRITSKRNGTAHVDFAAHDGLRQAMAASPVGVSEQITVRVVELKHCGNCGKAGHVARACRAAKSTN